MLCTVDDPGQALAEIARVLKPGGEFVFMEHVRSRDDGLAAWQDRVAPVWLRFAYGCRCNRPTPETIEAFDGLDLGELRRDSMPRAVPWIRPLAIERPERPDVLAQLGVRPVHEQHEHRPVDRQVAGQLGRAVKNSVALIGTPMITTPIWGRRR